MRTHALIVMTASLLLAADTPSDDLKKLQGTWKIAALIFDGRPVEDAEIQGGTLTVAGDEYTATIGEQVLKVRLRLDPSRRRRPST